MEIVIVAAVTAALGLAGVRWGTDSRPGFRAVPDPWFARRR